MSEMEGEGGGGVVGGGRGFPSPDPPPFPNSPQSHTLGGSIVLILQGFSVLQSKMVAGTSVHAH